MSAPSEHIQPVPAAKLAGSIASNVEDGGQILPNIRPPNKESPENKSDDDNEDREDDGEDGSSRPNAEASSSPPLKPFGIHADKTSALLLPSFVQLASKVALGAVVTLYVLNQQHVLPRGLSSVVSKTLFWPTLPITFSKRIGKWSTAVDDVVVIGGAPFGWLNFPKKLHDDYGVRGVINMCEEYEGSTKQYKKLNIRELRLPTTDHFEPTVEDMKAAVEFIREHEKNGIGKVYVHCRAGHGRSAAIVLAWLMSKSDNIESLDLEMLNSQLCELRDVRKTLFKQPNVNEFRSWLSFSNRKKQTEFGSNSVDEFVSNSGDESGSNSGDEL